MYEIELSQSAFKFIQKTIKSHKKTADRIMAAIDWLKTEPLTGKKLSGDLKDVRSLRVGDYRILYSVIHQKLIIYVITIGYRREIYR